MYFLNLKNSFSPYFNLSIEEAILNDLNHKESLFFLWKNKDSVIIGKNQIPENEVNLDYCKTHQIPIIRRNSGGGAVFHDLGNINLSFLGNLNINPIEIVKDALNNIGINAKLVGRNDIQIGEIKISGWASYKKGNNNLIHGCLLFSSNLEKASNALKVNKRKLEKHGVSSIKKRITSLKESFPNLSEDKLIKNILKELQKNEKIKPFYLNKKLIKSANKLKEEKYQNKLWNYNKILRNTKVFKKQFPFGNIQLNYLLKDKRFKYFKLTGDFFSNKDISELNEFCQNKTITEILNSNINFNDYILGIDFKTFKDFLLHI